MTKGPVAERVAALVEPLVTSTGLELVDVEHGGGLLRITLDHADPSAGPIDLDTIATVSEQIADLLDVQDPDPVPGHYTLEVSSPGIERPLHTPDHFRRFAGTGTTVAVRTHADVEGERRIEGELTEADDDHIVVAGRRLAYADIERARTVFDWGASGSSRRGARKKPKTRGQRRR